MTHISNVLLYKLLASGFLSYFKKHCFIYLMRLLNTLVTCLLYLKVKIYQLQVPENKN